MATIMGGGGDKASKIIHSIAPLVGAGVGINAFLNTATAGFFGPQGVQQATFGAKLIVATSLVAGQAPAKSLFQAMNPGANFNGVFPGGTPGPVFTPQKAFNSTSLAGAGILIANYLIKEFGVPGYNKYAAPIIGAVGAGTLAGGIVGGIFDPPTNPAAIGNPAGRLAFAQASTPFLGAASAAMPGTQGGLSGSFNTGRSA